MQQVTNWCPTLTSIFNLRLLRFLQSAVFTKTLGLMLVHLASRHLLCCQTAVTTCEYGFVQAYARKQAQCLLEIADHQESPVMASLQRWSLEVASLFMALYINNPRAMDTIHASRMDTGLPSKSHRDQFHNSLLVSCRLGSALLLWLSDQCRRSCAPDCTTLSVTCILVWYAGHAKV